MQNRKLNRLLFLYFNKLNDNKKAPTSCRGFSYLVSCRQLLSTTTSCVLVILNETSCLSMLDILVNLSL